MNIDIERLRQDLIEYFGTASTMFPMAIINVTNVETADYYKLIKIAKSNGFDLNKYVIGTYAKKLFK